MGHVSGDGLMAGRAQVKLPGRSQTGSDPKCLQNGLIAIIDDDQYARAGLQALIESLGQRAAAFATAEEYLGSHIKESTACLILDVHLPGMSGPDLHASQIAEGSCPPTIFVTGQFDEHVRKRVVEAGALGYFIKLRNDNELLSCIGAVLRTLE